MNTKEFLGELVGTFILVLFGCGSVAVAVLFGEYNSILQIGVAWGFGVMLAIYLTRHLSCAHLNPAVSIAMVVSKRMKARKLPSYLTAQLAGAFMVGLMIYLLFSPSIESYEVTNGIVRGTAASVDTARMFGEYYPNPGTSAVVTMPLAIPAEAFGTFLLVLLIFSLTEGCNVGRPSDTMAPVFIGLTVTSIICLIAPPDTSRAKPGKRSGSPLSSMDYRMGTGSIPGQ